MDTKAGITSADQTDHLGDYIIGAGKLPGKLAAIIAHQKESAAGLARAAAHLRAIADMGRKQCNPESRNFSLGNEKTLATRL